MKLALVVAVVGCVAAPSRSVAAQPSPDATTSSPLGEAARDASREEGVGHSDAASVGWSRVRRLAPGTDITLTLEGSPAGRRYVVRATESDVTVLNVADPPLSAAAIKVLRAVATAHADHLMTALAGGRVVLDGGTRFGPDGAFVGGQRVADLAQVLHRVGRARVTEITTRRRGRGFWGHMGPLGGYFLGGLSGGLVAGLVCQGARGRDRCDSGAFLTGMLVGGVAGSAYGLHAALRETEEVVYRAPWPVAASASPNGVFAAGREK